MGIKKDLALNNLYGLICYKPNQPMTSTILPYFSVWLFPLEFVDRNYESLLELSIFLAEIRVASDKKLITKSILIWVS